MKSTSPGRNATQAKQQNIIPSYIKPIEIVMTWTSHAVHWVNGIKEQHLNGFANYSANMGFSLNGDVARKSIVRRDNVIVKCVTVSI